MSATKGLGHTALCGDHVRGLLDRLPVGINQQQARALAGKQDRRCPAIADGLTRRLAGADDNGDLVFQAHDWLKVPASGSQ